MAAETGTPSSADVPAAVVAAAEAPAAAGAHASAPPAPASTEPAANAGAPASGTAASAAVASVGAHPRAARVVRRSREAAGLVGFLLGGWMSLSTHSLADAMLRAVLAGALCQLVVWAAAVTLCRYLVAAELRSREDALLRAAVARRRALAGAGQPSLGAPSTHP